MRLARSAALFRPPAKKSRRFEIVAEQVVDRFEVAAVEFHGLFKRLAGL